MMFGVFKDKARLFLMEHNLGGEVGSVEFESLARALHDVLVNVASSEREAVRDFLKKRLEEQAHS